MRSPRELVRRMLRDWKGEDAAAPVSPDAIAEQIDELYQEYIASLPLQTMAILEGQKAQELLVA